MAAECDIELLAWDRRSNVNKLKVSNSATRARIHLGIPLINLQFVAQHILYCIGVFFQSPVRFIRFYYFLRSRLGWINGIRKLIRYYLFVSIQADVVHFEFGTLAKEMIFLKEFFGFKAIVSFRGYDLNYVGLENSSYYDEVWRRVDGFHFLGQDLASRAIKRGYSRAHGVEVLIPPAIDVDFFKRNSTYPEASGKWVIVSVGRIVWKKGLEYSLRVIRRLVNAGYPIEFRIVGTGDYIQAIRYTIFELNLEDQVVLLGSLSPQAIKQQLEQAHVFLHLAVSEGFCNAVVEAQAMELPVVCSDADGLSENVENGKTGFVVPKWDIERPVEKMKELLDAPEKARLMGLNGRLRVLKLFKINDQIDRFNKFYKEV